jgi:hypothetical protein
MMRAIFPNAKKVVRASQKDLPAADSRGSEAAMADGILGD